MTGMPLATALSAFVSTMLYKKGCARCSFSGGNGCAEDG
jgi:hypothetical protein